MNEVELKFLDIDIKKIISKLEMIGAKKDFEGNIIQSYFDYKNKYLRRKNTVLRVRIQGNRVVLCLKKSVSRDEAKIMDEIEVDVSDYNKLLLILKSLGLSSKSTIKKYRISYALGKFHFDIDKIPGIPRYLEVEANTIEELKQAVVLMDLNFEDGKTWSQKELVDYYKEKQRQ